MYLFFFFNDTATTEIYTLSLHDALPIFKRYNANGPNAVSDGRTNNPGSRQPYLSSEQEDALRAALRSEEHTSELQSRQYLVCRLLLEKKNKNTVIHHCCDLSTQTLVMSH